MRRIAVSDGSVLLDTVVLGTAGFGTDLPEEKAFAQMDCYYACGGRTLDTAAVYGDWEDKGEPKSERTIARWVRSRGVEDITVITKGCHYRLKTPEISRVTPEAIRADAAQSLEALERDAIDVYLLHRDNPAVPVGELVDALDEFAAKGALRSVGVSNWTFARIAAANEYARKNGRTPFTSSELQWSLAQINPARDNFPNLPHMTPAEFENYRGSDLAVLAWSAQAGGVISKMLARPGFSLEGNKFDTPETRLRAQRVEALSRRTGLAPGVLTLAYLLNSGVQSAAVVGASSPEQIRESVSAGDVSLTPEQVSFLEGA
ncbi:MAG TPA: aldo/keto reductase [Candidatus Merdivicinus intestinavium]|nr:aldo/keto reductase [Candidatus Merdivicinus intestinavium]